MLGIDISETCLGESPDPLAQFFDAISPLRQHFIGPLHEHLSPLGRNPILKDGASVEKTLEMRRGQRHSR